MAGFPSPSRTQEAVFFGCLGIIGILALIGLGVLVYLFFTSSIDVSIHNPLFERTP